MIGTQGVRPRRSGGEYNDRNRELFLRRGEILRRLDEIGRSGSGEERRLRGELDSVDTAIVELNYGLVRNYVRRFTSTTSAQDSQDFEAAGILGLMRAIATYDPERRTSFSTWAFKPIQRECLRAVRDADFKQLNPGDFEKRPEILRIAAELAAEASDDDGNLPPGYQPDYEHIAERMRTSTTTVRRILHSHGHDTLSRTVGEDEGTELGDLIEDRTAGPEEQVIHAREMETIERYALTCLEQRELYVICRRFGLDGEPAQRLSAIGRTLGLSREAVRQIEAKALSKINHPTVRRRILRHGRD